MITILTSGSFVAINIVWARVCNWATYFERNHTWTSYCLSKAFKLLCFRVFSTIILYVLTAFVIISDNMNNCTVITTVGAGFFLSIISNTLINDLLLEIVIPWFLKSKPEFNVADEIQQTLYRQLMINLSKYFCKVQLITV